MSERRGSSAYYNYSEYITGRQGLFPYPQAPTQPRRTRRKNEPVPTNGKQALARTIYEQYRSEHPFAGLGNRDLPVHKHRREIVDTIADNKVTLLDGETGSGKSTQTWQYLLGEGYDKIFVLVPRKIIADNLYERAQFELSQQVDAEHLSALGVAHADRAENVDDGRVVFMTPNTYVRMANQVAEEHADQKIAVISDEIHESNLYSEIATGVAAMQVDQRDNWRLVLSSATHDHSRLESVYGRLNPSGVLARATIEGRPSTLEKIEEPALSPVGAYLKHFDEHERSMIFTNGVSEINETVEQLRKALDGATPGGSDKVEIRILHGKLTPQEQALAAGPNPNGRRVVIVSSPAGMSGITIPGISLVVTDGTINRKVLRKDGSEGLYRYDAAQSEILQMGGRAGRDTNGGVLVLAKPTELKETVKTRRKLQQPDAEFVPFAARERHAPAEIYNTPMGRTILSTEAQGFPYEKLNEWLQHKVTNAAIKSGQQLLVQLGALDDEYAITQRGARMDEVPISPELSRAVVEAMTREGVTRMQMARTALIAAAVSAGGLQDFSVNTNNEWKKLLRSGSKTSDYIAQLDLMFATRNMTTTAEIRSHDISPVNLQRSRKLANKILRILNIDGRNIDITPALPHEAEELHSLFLTGALAGSIHRKKQANSRGPSEYESIFREEEPTQRHISNRSVMATMSREPDIIAGDARHYRLRSRPDEEHNIVEMAFPIDKDELIRQVQREGLADLRLEATKLNDKGEVVDVVRQYYGTLSLGGSEERVAAGGPSRRSRELLFEGMQKNPGKALGALYEIRSNLEKLEERVGEAAFKEYMRPHRSIPSSQYIHHMMQLACERAKSLSHADRLLGEEMYQQGVLELDHYIDYAMRQQIEQDAPLSMQIGGRGHDIRYHKGVAYITLSGSADFLRDVSQLQLPDGREILVQITKEEGRGTERVSLNEAKLRLGF